MAHHEVRRPIFETSPPAVAWREVGDNFYIDQDLDSLSSNSVYRYSSIAEAILLCRGKVSFAKPDNWPDKYEGHLVRALFSDGAPYSKTVPFVKCFSIEYSSEAMWRVYASSGGLVRMGIRIPNLIEGLKKCVLPFPAKIYLGRVRYMEAFNMRKAIEEIATSYPKKVMNNAMSALLMKRSGFSFENELRVAIFPSKNNNLQEVITLEGFPIESISRMLIDPYLSKWQADLLGSIFVDQLRVPFDVHRSSFDDDPSDI